MRPVPDWTIQTSWWASGIFATGGVWYFLSTHEYGLALAAGIAAILFAAVAIALHRRKDAQVTKEPAMQQQPIAAVPIEIDKMVTSDWWNSSELRREYERRGQTTFRWSNADRVPEREQEGYKVVYLRDEPMNTRYRLVNRSGQVLVAKS